MDDDAAPTDDRRWICAVPSAHLVVIDNVGHIIRNLDPELVAPATAADLPVNNCDCEGVAARAVDRTGAAILRMRIRNNQPVIGGAVEVQAGELELELGLARRLRPALVAA